MSKQKTWRANDVYGLLEKRFPAPAFTLLPQVRNGTGFARAERTADAIAISCYPSRGLNATGIEIKVSTGDWRKELANPNKANAIQKFCLYWYVAAPKGVVPLDEVPENWGLLECTKNSIRATKAAPKLSPIPPDWLIVASILRAASKASVSREEHGRVVEMVRAETKDAIARAARLDCVEYELKQLQQSVSEFQEASGVNIENEWQAGRIGAAVKATMVAKRRPAAQIRDAIASLSRAICTLEEAEKLAEGDTF